MKTTSQSTLSGGASVLASQGGDSRGGSQGRSPHRYAILVALLFVTTLARAATNDLSGLLQKGLFEEEANRNLDAASAAYQTLVTQLDKDRQIGATAIFRLGEVYRKQGKTNEAAAQYERIVRDFAEQTTLVTLSRQNLAGLRPPENRSNWKPSLMSLDQMRDDIERFQLMIASYQALPQTNRLDSLCSIFDDDAVIASDCMQLKECKKRVQILMLNGITENHPTMVKLQTKISSLETKVETDASEKIGKLIPFVASLEKQLQRRESEAVTSSTSNPDLTQLQKLSRAELLQVLPTLVPDQLLPKLLEQQNTAATRYTELSQDLGPNSPEIKKLAAVRGLLDKQIDERVAGILKAMELRSSVSGGGKPTTTVSTVVDEEEAEIRRIQGMIQNSPDLINAQIFDSNINASITPLCRAASKGQLRVAGFLLDHGADLNLNLPLSQAAGAGHKAMVELLLKYGAPVNAATGSGETALQRAAQRGFGSVVEVLLNAKADPNLRDDTDRTALTLAAENNFVPTAAALLARGANPNIVCKTRKNWGSDRTTCGAPIHFAITRTGDALLALLLTNRADVMLRNPLGETPLDIAASLGLTGKARQLIAAGAEVNPADATNSGAATPLYYAVSGGHREVTALLLEQGANPNIRILSGQEGVTPLMIAASKGDTEIISLLLKHKAEPNLADSKSCTALWNAIFARSAKSVRVLLAGGANPNTTGPSGTPVLMSAVGENRDSEMVATLIEAKVNVNTTDASAKTPLHYAVMVNRKDLAELLLAAGADANARDKSGKTPLDYTKPSPLPSPTLPAIPSRVSQFQGGQDGLSASTTPIESKPTDIAGVLRQYGALNELPDFTRIRITRQGLEQPLEVFSKGSKLTNRFMLLETVMGFFARSSVKVGNFVPQPANQVLPFPDFGRITIRRPSQKAGGKEQEIKVSLLNSSNTVDCAKDVPVQLGDVIEIPERVHALNAFLDNSVKEMEEKFEKAQRAAYESRKLMNEGLSENHPTMVQFAKQKTEANAAIENLVCLRKSVQLVVGGETTSFTIDSWKEGFLGQALSKPEARSALRSSSDLTRVQVKRKDAKTGKLITFTVDNTDATDALWLQTGDVIEVPDKP